MMAGATGLPVVAGPIEATSIGNLLVQMNATDEIVDIAEGRRLIRETMSLDEYAPRHRDEWKTAVERMASLVD
jgi:sugar (pentulose or hexulose) kinase